MENEYKKDTNKNTNKKSIEPEIRKDIQINELFDYEECSTSELQKIKKKK